MCPNVLEGLKISLDLEVITREEFDSVTVWIPEDSVQSNFIRIRTLNIPASRNQGRCPGSNCRNT